MKRAHIVDIILYAFVLLFVYTALSKLFLYDVYYQDLQRSPELRPFAVALSFIVPGIELVISTFLIIRKTKLLGLYSAVFLMLIFTVYVGYVLRKYDNYPCSCGGLIKELTWRQHFLFNIAFTLLGLIAIVLQKKDNWITPSNNHTTISYR